MSTIDLVYISDVLEKYLKNIQYYMYVRDYSSKLLFTQLGTIDHVYICDVLEKYM